MAKLDPTKLQGPTPAATPGTKDDAGKGQDKQPKPHWPALLPLDDDGNPTQKLKSHKEAADYDHLKYQKLGKGDFEQDWEYERFRAAQLEKRAAEIRKKADEAERLGDLGDQKKAKRLLALRDRFDQLKAELGSEGVDVESILAAVAGGGEKGAGEKDAGEKDAG